MAQLEWAVICDYANFSQDGKLSVIGIFDHIGAQKFPAIHPFFFFVSVWQTKAGEAFKVGVSLIAPSGEEHKMPEVEIKAASERHSHNTAFITPKFPVPGEYRVQVTRDGEIAGSFPLTLDKVSGRGVH
jgi:hypothetical protein